MQNFTKWAVGPTWDLGPNFPEYLKQNTNQAPYCMTYRLSTLITLTEGKEKAFNHFAIFHKMDPRAHLGQKIHVHPEGTTNSVGLS